MSAQRWDEFGRCAWCEALPGEPCGDIRAARRSGQPRRPIKRPHRFRERRPS